MSKKYYTSKNAKKKNNNNSFSKTTKSNHGKVDVNSLKPMTTEEFKNNAKGFLKLDFNSQPLMITKMFFDKIKSSRNSITDIYNYYDEIEKLKPFFLNKSVNKWRRVSGLDYTKDGFSVPQEVVFSKDYQNGNYSKNLILELEKSINTKGTVNGSDYSFYIGDDKMFNKLFNSPKKVVAEMHKTIASDHEDPTNIFIINQVLESTIDGKTYLFLASTRSYENYPGMHSSLDLIVNGKAEGIKHLARVDSLGHLPIEFLDEMNIEPLITDEFYDKLLSKGAHPNPKAPNRVDPLMQNQESQISEQLHHISAMQDLAMLAADYIVKTLGLQGKSPLMQMAAKNINLYKLENTTYAGLLNKMKKDADLYDGVVPIKRLIDWRNGHFNISDTKYNNDFYKLIDDGRSMSTKYAIPKVDMLHHEGMEDKGLTKAPIDYYVRNQKLGAKPINKNLKYYDLTSYLINKFNKEQKLKKHSKLAVWDQQKDEPLKNKTNHHTNTGKEIDASKIKDSQELHKVLKEEYKKDREERIKREKEEALEYEKNRKHEDTLSK